MSKFRAVHSVERDSEKFLPPPPRRPKKEEKMDKFIYDKRKSRYLMRHEIKISEVRKTMALLTKKLDQIDLNDPDLFLSFGKDVKQQYDHSIKKAKMTHVLSDIENLTSNLNLVEGIDELTLSIMQNINIKDKSDYHWGVLEKAESELDDMLNHLKVLINYLDEYYCKKNQRTSMPSTSSQDNN